VRPLREMTGHALFNETFITDAHAPADALIGGLNNGWAVANTTLSYERSGLGAGAGNRGATAVPGTIAGNLERRVGDFVSKRTEKKKPSAPANPRGAMFEMLLGLAKGNGKNQDKIIRQDLVKLYALGELGRLNGERLKATRARGGDIPGLANIAKLSMSSIVRLQRDLGLRIVGAQGMIHAYDSADQATVASATGNPFLGAVTGSALYAQAPPIYGGTDQIQMNIIGERVLGLPKEPNNDKTVSFAEMPKNA